MSSQRHSRTQPDYSAKKKPIETTAQLEARQPRAGPDFTETI